MLHQSDGFTLIELLVVTVVISLLAAIAIPSLLHNREEAWGAAVKADLHNAAIEFVVAAGDNNGQYPVVMPPAVRTSAGVTLTVGGSASASRICLEGDHAGLATTTYYDSNAGGITDAAC